VDWRLLLLGVMAVSAIYVAWHLGRGWVAHDEGSLAQSAERFMQGELPHRDFDEIYTGGLSVLHAAAFRLFGTTLFSMRIVLFAVFMAWIPAVFYVASRLVRPTFAAAVTLLCVVWTLPNYPAPLPSWYNLFLATIGLAALFRWLEDRRPRWLVAAGIAAGLSLLVKIIALYFVAGVLLFLVFQAHEQARATAGPDGGRPVAYQAFVTASLMLFASALLIIVRKRLFAGEVLQFVVPGTLIAGLLAYSEWALPGGTSRERFGSLVRLGAPFLLGFVVPIAIFLIPYIGSGSLDALLNGLFVLPSRRIGSASYPMLSPWTMLALVPVGLFALYARRLPGRPSRAHVVGFAVILIAILIATARIPLLYRIVWYAARSLPPVLAVLGVVLLARIRPADGRHPLLRAQSMLLLAVMSVLTLVQFPFAVTIYFCYLAPLVVLSTVSLSRYAAPVGRAVPGALIAFLIAFAALRTNTSALFGMGTLYRPYPLTAELGLPRGGLDVPAWEAAMYHATISTLQQRARGGYTFASPDCPEIYFLSGLRNPTRSLFEFFDDEPDRTPRTLAALERHGVTAIVLNSAPTFTKGLPTDLLTALEARYPEVAVIGKFQVRSVAAGSGTRPAPRRAP
jgi:hypothetical protein